jgi:hypothetical protein
MAPEDVRKLIGGWAAGTLTESERKALLEAALEDQELFNTLVAEQPMKELLDDPSARAELLAAVSRPESRSQGRFAWLFRPWPLAAAGAVAAGVILTVAISLREHEKPMVAEYAQKAAVPPQVQPEVPMESPKEPSSKAKLPRRKEAAAAKAPEAPASPSKPHEAVAKDEIVEMKQPLQVAQPSGVVGGVPGGVIGGIISPQKAAAPPPPPPPPPPPKASLSENRAAVRQYSVEMPATGSFRTSLRKSEERADIAAALAQPFTFKILKRAEGNEFREAPEGTRFVAGDSVVLSVDALQNGYLQLFEGATQLSGLLTVQAGGHYTLPSEGRIELGDAAKDRVLTLRFIQNPSAPVINVQIPLKGSSR